MLLLAVSLHLVLIQLATCFCDCPAGSGCQIVNGSSICQPCIDGLTYSINNKCEPCRKCAASGVELTICNTTHNTVCQNTCDREFYWDVAAGKCRQCRLCPHGYGVLSPCGPTNDAVCLQCPVGSFSDVLSSTSECVPCSKCRMDQTYLHNCTNIQDTICIDRKFLPNFRKSATPVDVNRQVTEFGEGLLPFYCTLLSVVIFGLVLYVVIKKWLLSRQKSHKLPIHDDHCSLLLRAKLNSVPASKRNKVEELLNPRRLDQRDWTALARQFGYSCPQIVYLQKFRCTEGGSARQLFTQLEKSGVTIDVFVQALMLIGRGDVAGVLKPHLIKSIDRGVVV